jgi:catechol 2,3-dioxygenase-like lactoylglutathione lyase family enzyme
MLDIETLHHVSLPVTDLSRARRFYGDVLGLEEIARPPFDFPGAWYRVGDRTLHLIVAVKQTFRSNKPMDTRDVHFAIRVRSFRGALEHLKKKGYRSDAKEEFQQLLVRPKENGFPQIFVLDPDRNVIEINAAGLD